MTSDGGVMVSDNGSEEVSLRRWQLGKTSSSRQSKPPRGGGGDQQATGGTEKECHGSDHRGPLAFTLRPELQDDYK